MKILAIISVIVLKIIKSDFIDIEDFLGLLLRFSFNFIVIFVIVRFIYYSTTKKKNYLFTYILMSTVIFLLCFLLENVKLELGFALGLFALFGIIRYRTNPIPIKEMTYLFVIIGISIINALANKKISYTELIFTNVSIIAILWVLEFVVLMKNEIKKRVIYERIEMLKPENRELLLEDLRKRTGYNIHRFEINEINFLRDTVRINVFYYADESRINPFADKADASEIIQYDDDDD